MYHTKTSACLYISLRKGLLFESRAFNIYMNQQAGQSRFNEFLLYMYLHFSKFIVFNINHESVYLFSTHRSIYLQLGLSLRYAPCTISISVTDKPKIQRYSSTRVLGTWSGRGIQPTRSLGGGGGSKRHIVSNKWYIYSPSVHCWVWDGKEYCLAPKILIAVCRGPTVNTGHWLLWFF